MTDLRVRAATTNDVLALATIHVESWRAAYRGMLPDAVLDGLSIESRVRDWTGFLTSPTTASHRHLVLDADGVVAGFAVVAPSRDEGAPAGELELIAIYLAPVHFGRGYGVPLLAAAVAEARAQGATAVVLWVLAANARARRFYEREGFVLDGAEKLDAKMGALHLRYRQTQRKG